MEGEVGQRFSRHVLPSASGTDPENGLSYRDAFTTHAAQAIAAHRSTSAASNRTAMLPPKPYTDPAKSFSFNAKLQWLPPQPGAKAPPSASPPVSGYPLTLPQRLHPRAPGEVGRPRFPSPEAHSV